jgi:hypothetical protein
MAFDLIVKRMKHELESGIIEGRDEGRFFLASLDPENVFSERNSRC